MTAAADLALTHVSLLVDDQDKALAFYRDTIGLVVRTDVPLFGIRWLTVGPASQPNLEFILEVPQMNPDAAGQKAARDRLAAGGQGTLIFTTADCDATFARLRDAGVKVTQEPTDQPYGVRDCGFTDPWGNHLRFSQVLAR